MREVQLWGLVRGSDSATLFDIVSDFERYPEMTDAVRSVAVQPLGDGTIASDWAVNFRNGILRWSEEDRLDREARRIDFQQTGGDFEHFSGRWELRDVEDGCLVGFTAQFDLGIPSLSYMLDPIAEQALLDNLEKIVVGLAGQPVEFAAAEPA